MGKINKKIKINQAVTDLTKLKRSKRFDNQHSTNIYIYI